MLATTFSVGNSNVVVLHQRLATLFVNIWHLKSLSANGRSMGSCQLFVSRQTASNKQVDSDAFSSQGWGRLVRNAAASIWKTLNTVATFKCLLNGKVFFKGF